MKNLILVLFVLVICSNVNAQNLTESQVPEAVLNAFNTIYPNADNVEWEAEGAYFEGGVKINDLVTSVLFDANGTVIQTESEIAISDLPEGVTDYISKNLNNGQIDEAAKITDPTGKISYG